MTLHPPGARRLAGAACLIAVTACADLLDIRQGTPKDGAAAGGQTSGGGGSGAGGGDPPAGNCSASGKAGSIVDDFDDGELDSQWDKEQDSFTLPSEENGRAVFSFNTSSDSGPRAAAFVSFNNVSIRGCSVTAELVTALPSSTPGEARFEIEMAGGKGYRIRARGGRLFVRDLETHTDLGDIPYSPTAHRWLQFREQAGQLYAAASANGVTFNDLISVDTPSEAGAVFIRIGGSVDSQSATGVVEFDNVNALP